MKNSSREFRSSTTATASSSTLPFRLRSALLRLCAFQRPNSAPRSMRGSDPGSSASRLRGLGRTAATVAAEDQTPAFARSADASLRPLEEA